MTIHRLNPDEHDWLSAQTTQKAFSILAGARPEMEPGGVARAVGGCVRNALNDVAVDDVDIATILPPEEAAAAFEAAGVKVVPTGIAHGTLTAVIEGTAFEVTTLRRDVETDGRRAVIAYTEDWAEDSERRDFRLNAIYCDAGGVLMDPQGGIADALSGRIRFIGDADTRIREDYLRILRFFRFHAWYGEGELDADGVAACAAQARGLKELSAERVWREVKKLLGAPDPAPVLIAMHKAGVLDPVLQEAWAFDLIGALVTKEAEEGWEAEPLVRLAALIPRLPDVVDRVARRLKLSNAERNRLEAWVGVSVNPRLLLGQTDESLAERTYGLDRPALVDRARLAWAVDAAEGETPEDQWRALIGFLTSWAPPVFPVSGNDLIGAGIAQGRQVGVTLKALEALWVRGGFKAGKDQLLQAAPLFASRLSN